MEDLTTPVDKSGFMALEPGKEDIDRKTASITQKQMDWQSNIADASKFIYEGFKQDTILSLLFIGIVGYIVIATFGHLENIQSYLQYIFFLLGLGIFYKILKKEIKIDLKFLMISFSLLVGFIMQLVIYLLILIPLLFYFRQYLDKFLLTIYP